MLIKKNVFFHSIDINQMDESSGGRICRFVTYDFPQYFAVVSRIRQEVSQTIFSKKKFGFQLMRFFLNRFMLLEQRVAWYPAL